MLCSPDVVRTWSTGMLAKVIKATRRKARRKLHGAARELEWSELVKSYPDELRELANLVHQAHEAGTSPLQQGGAPSPAPWRRRCSRRLAAQR
mmetsp:Transcript_1074/g.3979  ORF Transcript_1074/g.3979 Transcript_1074/m.3979 type:complete len:93 (+) Transcript_1074:75-353(+)